MDYEIFSFDSDDKFGQAISKISICCHSHGCASTYFACASLYLFLPFFNIYLFISPPLCPPLMNQFNCLFWSSIHSQFIASLLVLMSRARLVSDMFMITLFLTFSSSVHLTSFIPFTMAAYLLAYLY